MINIIFNYKYIFIYMLDYTILENKKLITKNNETYKDLLSNKFDDKLNFRGKLLTVNKWYIARPDLISFAVYGDDKYADILCKINGISNPFELNSGMVLFIPNFEYLTKYLSIDNEDDIISESNDELIEKKETFQKKLSDKRTPNQQVVGDSNYIIDKSLGIIFY